jgi:hypothetical protein
VHLFTTIPQPSGSNYKKASAPLIRELFSPERAGENGPYYFVRTWDGRSGAEILQISIDQVSDPGTTGDELRRLIQKSGFTARVEEMPLNAVPSPLWNAGFDGTEFSDLSKRLFQEAAPALVSFLNRAAEARDSLQSALDPLRLMVAHTRATLLRSPQRNLEEYDFRDLLSLRLLSYRSHFEAIYPRTKDPESFEASCARFYEQVGPATREFISACGDPNDEPAEDTPIRQWTDCITSESHALAKNFLNDTIVDVGRTLEDLVRERGAPVEPTRFHRPLSPELDHLMHRNADFLAFRLQTSMLYSCLYSLGFSLAERYVFCYVVARANEEASGKSTKQLQGDLDDLATSIFAASTTAAD